MLKAASSRDISATHDALFAKGIWTKSMVKMYLRCPVQFEQRFVLGRKEAPRWALAVGSVADGLFQEWGRRALAGASLTPAEARDALSDLWKLYVVEPGVRPEEGDPHPTADAKLAALLRIYEEWLTLVLQSGLGPLREVQPAYGYDGGVRLGGVPIAGHPDFVFRGPADLKCVSQKSAFLRGDFWANLADWVFQSALVGTTESNLIVTVHDYVRAGPSRVKLLLEPNLPPSAFGVMGEQVARVAEAVRRGSFPPTVTVGAYPCTAKWCGFFGSCPVTKGLK